jgi:hypothetical protein
MNEVQSSEALGIENEVRRINHNIYLPRLRNTPNE